MERRKGERDEGGEIVRERERRGERALVLQSVIDSCEHSNKKKYRNCLHYNNSSDNNEMKKITVDIRQAP